MLHNRACFRAQTCVEGRLSAAGLSTWKVNAQAQAAENADNGFTSFRVERIDQTGDEELHGRHELIVILNYHNRHCEADSRDVNVETQPEAISTNLYTNVSLRGEIASSGRTPSSQ
jgi:hypothetical protein